jgi:FkbM family methyltransferase
MLKPDIGLVRIRLRKLAALATDVFFMRAFLRGGVAPAIEHRSVLRRLPFDFVVDVGANRGQFSLMCRRLGPTAVIVAFEPLMEPAKIYRTIFAGDTRTRLHICALGTGRGEIAMNVSGHDDASSLLPISKIQTDNFPGTGAVSTRPVAVRPMSDFMQPSEMGTRNLLKIDVQGFELEVLKSGENVLPQFDWIYAECSFVPLYEGQALADEIIVYLEARGFRLSGQYNPSYARVGGGLLQADLLFENSRLA